MEDQQDVVGVAADDAPPDATDLAPPDDPPVPDDAPPIEAWDEPDPAPAPPGVDMGDDTMAPPGAPTGELGEAPPLPEGAGGGDGQSPFPDQGNDTPPEVSLGEPTPSAVDLAGGGDTDAAPPGQPTGEQGDAPPLPEGIDGGDDQSPIPAGQPGVELGGDAVPTAVGSADGDAIPSAVDLAGGGDEGAGAPPAAGTGTPIAEAPQAPDLPGGDGGDHSPVPTMGGGAEALATTPADDAIDAVYAGNDTDAPAPPAPGSGTTMTEAPERPDLPGGDGGEQSPVPTMGGGTVAEDPEHDPTGAPVTGETARPAPGAPDGEDPIPEPPVVTHTGLQPGDVDRDSALELVNAFLPHEDAQAVLAPVSGDDGEITSDKLIETLREHGLQPVGPEGHGAAKLEDVMSQVDKVHLVGAIDGKMVPLVADRVDDNGHTIVCVDRNGHEYDVRAEDANRAWQTSGSPLLAAPPAPAAGHAPAGGVQMAPPPTAPIPGAPSAPTAAGMPGIDAGAAPMAPPVGLAAAQDHDGGHGGLVLASTAAALVPIALGGGLLARRLKKKAEATPQS